MFFIGRAQNPFLDLFAKAKLYSKLKKIYTFESVPQNVSDQEKREFAIRYLQSYLRLNRLLRYTVGI